jgi:hypothetical protein
MYATRVDLNSTRLPGLVEPAASAYKLTEDSYMQHQATSLQDAQKEAKQNEQWHENHMKHWRAWGSWFSWGSPVGLGLFLMSLAFCVWLLGQTFNWG